MGRQSMKSFSRNENDPMSNIILTKKNNGSQNISDKQAKQPVKQKQKVSKSISSV